MSFALAQECPDRFAKRKRFAVITQDGAGRPVHAAPGYQDVTHKTRVAPGLSGLNMGKSMKTAV
ncbi:hypothetical protein [Marivita sp. S0852]|uniref:hypothetical protein n=1 Tax=Marivita sp. S0852 TaxID=3373893 RepID=UPI0039825EBD